MDNFSFMLSELKFTRWFFAAVCVFLVVQNFAHGESQEIRKVTATGAGLDVDAALKNAFKVAVEEAVGTLVDTETIVREDDTIEEKILSASNGFIKSYDLIRQWNEDGLIRCRIEALVEIRQLKERLVAANISTIAVPGTDLAAHEQTGTSAIKDAAAILSKRINDFPNRVLRIEARGEPVPDFSKQQPGVTRLKIPIMVFVDQAAYNQEVDELTAALDKLALEKVTGNLHLAKKERKGMEGLRGPSGVALEPTDRFYAFGGGFGEEGAAANALFELAREAQQRFSTLPEPWSVVTVMSGLSKTGTTKLSLYAVNKVALGLLDVATPRKIKVTVQLVDASGNELESYEHNLEPEDENGSGIPLALEKGRNSAADIGDVRIWPGLRTHPGGYLLQLSTSWAGDVYVDIDTEMLPRLKRCKLSVRMPEFPNSALAQTPIKSVGVTRAGEREVRRAEPATTTPPINPPEESAEIPNQRTLNGERYPQTRQHLLTMDDVKGMRIEQMRYAINEVYARYGATFPNVPDIQRQFQKFEWYNPKPGLTFEGIDRLMSDTERQNVKLLAQCRELKRSK
jgi:hypothetical protein